jgi:hypothetical protein
MMENPLFFLFARFFKAAYEKTEIATGATIYSKHHYGNTHIDDLFQSNPTRRSRKVCRDRTSQLA